MMRLKKRGIHIKISMEQEGIYKGKRTTPLRDIHVDPTYIVGKALSIFLESVHFGFLRNFLSSLSIFFKT
jgi:hypothetical protein